MDMTSCVNMDPNILLGIVNDKLRHECGNLQSLAALMDVDEDRLEDKLAGIGFHYDVGQNQFSPDLE
ncbi:DUF4250 domain-containing protein [Saccharobesus litoralis]|uniref:DUF4250 domain-containing protein n=1 Tax=Saccharobesus litoralis TaxID=2172099 RepID=A0A2S0VSQ2_9ALTE|nr:DUF4250 domain-containing protein [Saccharobesus litoralis]AWB67227.1 DUF4250 domain-containing protein [Saccharobesus litoralis]